MLKPDSKFASPRTIVLNVTFSILALGIIFFFVDIDATVAQLSSANIPLFIAAFGIYFLVNGTMIVRIKLILAHMEERMSWAKVLLCHYSGMLASDFTPARSGYFATAFALSSNGVPLPKSMTAILGPQLFDFLLKVTAGIISTIYILNFLGIGLEGAGLLSLAAGVIAIIGMIAFGALLLFSPAFLRFLEKILPRLPFGNFALTFIEGMQTQSKSILALLPQIFAIMAVSWALKGFEWYLISESLGIKLNFPYHPLLFFMFLQPFITILQFVPLPTVAGAGFSEAGALAVLGLFGVAAPQAAAFALLSRFIMIMQDIIGMVELRRLDFSAICGQSPQSSRAKLDSIAKNANQNQPKQ
jgi:uncharacterized protein (TIRG00374 family)